MRAHGVHTAQARARLLRPCLGVPRSGCGCQFAGDASCPVIDLRPVAEVAFGKSRGGEQQSRGAGAPASLCIAALRRECPLLHSAGVRVAHYLPRVGGVLLNPLSRRLPLLCGDPVLRMGWLGGRENGERFFGG
jgi:hypothetical protein